MAPLEVLAILCLVLTGGHSAVDNATTAGVTSPEPHYDADDGERVSYEGAQLLRVDARLSHVKDYLLKLEEEGVLDAWNGMPPFSSTVDVLVTLDHQMEVKKHFRDNNVTYKIAIENIQRAIDAENSDIDTEEELTARSGHTMTWYAYHSVDNIYTYMEYLVTTYPTYCRTKTIGTSSQGRPIKAMEIKLDGFRRRRNGRQPNPPPVAKPLVFIDGGMHGREWISVAAVMFVMKEIAENPESYTEYVGFSSATFYIVPVLNPDGYEYSRKKDRLWRKNRRPGDGRARSSHQDRARHRDDDDRRCDGVDLNRNFGYEWGGAGSSSKECKETYRGTGPFSEPETLAYKDFVLAQLALHTPTEIAAYLSFHSYGQSITFPWSYDRKVHDNYPYLQSVGNEMASRMKNVAGKTYKVGGFAPLFYPASGTSIDWFIDQVKIKYAYSIALRDKGRFGFLLPAHEIIPTGTEAMQAVVTLFA